MNIQDSTNNKEKLLQISLNLFSEKGYNATGIQEIVNLAGVTKPTMYYYFGNKEGILAEILSNKYPNYLQKLKEATKNAQDFSLSFFNLTKCIFEEAKRDFVFFRFKSSLTLYSEKDIAYSLSKKYIDKEVSIIKEFFTTVASFNGNVKGKEEICTICYIGSINACIASKLQNATNFELDDELIYKFRQQFLYGIF